MKVGKMSRLQLILITLILLSVGVSGGLYLAWQEQPRNEAYEFVQVAEGFDRPVYMTHAGDARLFVVEQVGRIRILEDGQVLDEPFLDIESLVLDAGNEQGLLSVAFHPEYAENGYFYVNYTAREGDGDTVIARYSVSPDNPNQADPASAQILLTIDQPYANHNGGLLLFGPDGYLYIGTGDGGSGNDPQNHAQNPQSLLGKMLRLDVNSPDAPYSIPADNPFIDNPDFLPEIWAWGLRNPWRFSFDSATDDLYIADVGQNAYEEINFQPATSTGGENYGWRIYEAEEIAVPEGAQAEVDSLIFPAHFYPHEGTLNYHCSVTGGYVYRGEALPELQGSYIYGDYCSGTVWTLAREGETWVNEEFINSNFNISSFALDSAGELYLLSLNGDIWQLVAREG